MVYITGPGYPLDDSWIHQTMARNLADGDGFGMVPGKSLPTATAPLWTLVMVIPGLLLGPVWSGILTGFLLGLLSLAAIYKLAAIFLKDKNSPLLVALLVVLCWPFIWGMLSGMEVPLFTALSFWGLYFYFKSRSLSDRYNYLSYILFSLSFLSRPECGLFLAAIFFHDSYRWWISKNKAYSPWAIKIAIIGLIFGPYFIFNYSTSGSFLPRTFTVKVQEKGLLTAIYHGEVKRIIKTATIIPYKYFVEFFRRVIKLNPVIVLALIPGLINLFRNAGIDKSRRVMLVVLMVFYTPIVGAVSPVYGVVFQNYRFSTNLLPLVIMIGYLGLFQPPGILERKSRNRLLIIGAILVVGGYASLPLFGLVDEFLARSLLQDPSVLDAQWFAVLDRLVWYLGSGTMIMGAYFICAFIIMTATFQSLINIRKLRILLLIVIFLTGGIITLMKSDRYANNVKNINECDVAAGRYLAGLAVPGDVVAVNDIGAIGYYCDMEIFDLKGLASPAITIPLIKNDSLAFEYMLEHKRVDYLAINPDWFEYIPTRTDIFKPLRIFYTDYNTILYSDTVIVYKAYWPPGD